MRHKHILVIRFSALGDVAMTVPVVHALAVQYPDVRITVLSRPFARPFFEDLAPNVSFMAADIKGEYKGIRGLNSLYRRIVAKQFTHVADLHSVLRSSYLRFRFNLGRFRVEHLDKHRRQRRQLTHHKVRKASELGSQVSNYIEVFNRLGFPISEPQFTSLFPPEGGDLGLLPRAVGQKRSWEKWIGIAPFAAHRGKVYPLERMHEVVCRLCQQSPSNRLFLFGSGDEELAILRQWSEEMPQCLTVADHLETMHQELILMSHLDVMVSMDSANMHLASLTATPVVSIWGATHPSAGFMGWHQSPGNAVSLDLDCRPCSIYGQKSCRYGDYRCLTGITPDMVFEKINNILNPDNH